MYRIISEESGASAILEQRMKYYYISIKSVRKGAKPIWVIDWNPFVLTARRFN